MPRHVSFSYSAKDQENNPVLLADSRLKQAKSHEQASSTVLSHTTEPGNSHSQSVTPPKRKSRAGKSKVKTGCVTCRASRAARRVKCDGAKPSCLRCQKFGRTCDGYAPETQGGRYQLQPPITSRTLSGPTVSIHSTEEEHRYFQIFIDHFAHEVPGFFDPELWTVLIPQAAHTYKCIRHSVNALGALCKALESSPGPNLKVIVIQSIDKKHHESAVLQHLMAIQSLMSDVSHSASPQLRTALLAALLFICFETLQGQDESATQQLVGSLGMIRAYYLGQPGSNGWVPASKSHSVKFSNDHSKIAFQKWKSKIPLATDRGISRHVEEYFDSCIIQPDPDIGSQHTLESLSHDTSVHQPNEVTKIPAAKSIELYPDSNAAGFPTIYSWLLGLSSDDHEEPSSDENQADTDDSNSVTSQDRVSSYLASRRPSSTFSLSSKLTGGTRTTLSTSTHLKSSPMEAPNPNGSRPPPGLETAPRPQPTPRLVPTLHSTERIEDIVLRTFMRLDSNDIFLGVIPQIPPLEWDIQEIWSLSIPATPFEDIASAHLCWDSLMNRALKFYRRICFNQTYCPSLQCAAQEIIDQLQSCFDQLTNFYNCFTPLLKNAISSETGQINSPVALLISVYWRLVYVLLGNLMLDPEMIYDNYINDFEYIVKTCTHLASYQSTTSASHNPRFTLEIGIIPALHFTATKCRDPVIRREAISLMFQYPRQEGEYDGVLCARIGRWIAACEEDGLLIELPGPVDKEPLSPSSRLRQEPMSPTSPPRQDWDDTFQLNKATEIDAGVPPRQTVEAYAEDTDHKTQIVPEENRFVLTVIDYHTPERFLKAKIQKAVPGPDGTREERETVIAW
ncbi:hypothetical protein DL98DRAFT_445117 [Cadophora sp. DSE1049]|nr:hypothetical protein DL98DRAFT_445117 [Cadophora sp. DSE1049]